MKRFSVLIPEVRQETYLVEYEIEAESIEKVREIINDSELLEDAEWVDAEPDGYGWELIDTHYDEAKIEELKDDTK